MLLLVLTRPRRGQTENTQPVPNTLWTLYGDKDQILSRGSFEVQWRERIRGKLQGRENMAQLPSHS